MIVLLNTISKMIDDLDIAQIEEPDGEIELDDSVIGTLEDEELKKLYHLANIMKRQAIVLRKMHDQEINIKAKRYLKRKLCERENMATILEELFWGSANNLFNLWGLHGVTLRRGWTVVALSEVQIAKIKKAASNK